MPSCLMALMVDSTMPWRLVAWQHDLRRRKFAKIEIFKLSDIPLNVKSIELRQVKQRLLYHLSDG